MRWVTRGSGTGTRAGGVEAPRRSPRSTAIHALVTVALAAVALWGWMRPGGDETPDATPVRMTLADFEFSLDTDRRPVISADGSFMVLQGPDPETPYRYLKRYASADAKFSIREVKLANPALAAFTCHGV